MVPLDVSNAAFMPRSTVVTLLAKLPMLVSNLASTFVNPPNCGAILHVFPTALVISKPAA
jgi:hypothetical protein